MLSLQLYRTIASQSELKPVGGYQVIQANFWSKLLSLPGITMSRNGFRAYLPFEQTVQARTNMQQKTHYKTIDEQSTEYKCWLAVCDYAEKHMMEVDWNGWNYTDGHCILICNTQQGKKGRSFKIGKLLSNAKLRDDFAADTARLTKSIIDVPLAIAFSRHAYDILGMSTGRTWTSCMNIINGSNADEPACHVANGAIVAYLVKADDKNINNPLGRVMLLPWQLQRTGYHGFAPRETVYVPDTTVYSSYAGLQNVREHIDKLCRDIQHANGSCKLKKCQNVYYDDFFNKSLAGTVW